MQLDENGKTAAHCSGRIAYQSSSERTQERRWVEVYAVIDHLMSIAGGETALTHMMVDALGRGLAPMGHGGKAARALEKKDDILAVCGHVRQWQSVSRITCAPWRRVRITCRN